jgi:hypothetical protein
MRPEDVDGMRRIGGTLTGADTERLLDSCQTLLGQPLNELARIVTGR